MFISFDSQIRVIFLSSRLSKILISFKSLVQVFLPIPLSGDGINKLIIPLSGEGINKLIVIG